MTPATLDIDLLICSDYDSESVKPSSDGCCSDYYSDWITG